MYNDATTFCPLSSGTHTCLGGTTFSDGTFTLGPNYHTTIAGVPLTSDETHILRDGGRIRRVPLTEIAAVAAEGHYTRVFLATEPPMFILRSVNAWAEQLPAQKFLRIGRSLIVNLARVRAIEAHSRDESQVTLAAIGASLTLRRAASARLRTALSAERSAPVAGRA